MVSGFKFFLLRGRWSQGGPKGIPPNTHPASIKGVGAILPNTRSAFPAMAAGGDSSYYAALLQGSPEP